MMLYSLGRVSICCRKASAMTSLITIPLGSFIQGPPSSATAPKYAGKDYVNPGSEILSAEMMLRHMGWTEAADLIISSMEKAILSKKVTYDFARLMEGATQVSCSGFGQVMIDNM